MSKSLSLTLPKTSATYDIEIGRGILEKQIPFLKSLANRLAIITDDVVAPLYGEDLHRLLSRAGLDAHLFSFPHGEPHKTRETKEHLENAILEKGFGRDTCIIGLGGGVVTDIAGFVAATFCRGIPHIFIPTTLLAMVDASIGGKTGVNHPYGKNLIGALHHPRKVTIDLNFLKSLPPKELQNGLVETLKHALVADKTLFEQIENNQMTIDSPLFEEMIFNSCLIKKEIVEKDERKNGIRHLLNFGHTIGHAIEKVSNYQISHGEAVSIGMIGESLLSHKMGLLDPQDLDKIQQIFCLLGLPMKLPHCIKNTHLLEAMTQDKKSLKGHPRFVMLESIGKCHAFQGSYCTHSPSELLIEALKAISS